MSSSIVGAIDLGTNSARFLLFDSKCQLRNTSRKEMKQSHPNEGWFEEDPEEMMDCVEECMQAVVNSTPDGILRNIAAIGITNQRETTILWDKTTGKCFYNAIVWCDNRTEALAEELISHTPTKSKDHWKSRCGLPIHPYFSALKIKWIIDNVPEVREAISNRTCLFGTVDTWLIWNLTGGVSGGCHVTDVTNASRTMLMDIKSCQWDTQLCEFFGIDMSILPKICSSSERYGQISDGPLKGVTISGCLGDQQAALVGQRCFKEGDAKNTYGTGCFLLYNTGQRPVESDHGMLTTVGYQLGPSAPVYYALEGSVAIAGQTVRWLRDNLQLFSDSSEIEALASKVNDTGGVYFVPAFSGLYAPYWQPDARGLIIGLSSYTNKSHICRATLESVCFQSKEILDAMNCDSKLPLASLKVDGGMTTNQLMLQLQADILGIPVECPSMAETTVLGAAIAAGIGVGVWSGPAHIPPISDSELFHPTIPDDDRDSRYHQWKRAVQRSMHWQTSSDDKDTTCKQWNEVKKVGLTFTVGMATSAAILGSILVLRNR